MGQSAPWPAGLERPQTKLPIIPSGRVSLTEFFFASYTKEVVPAQNNLWSNAGHFRDTPALFPENSPMSRIFRISGALVLLSLVSFNSASAESRKTRMNHFAGQTAVVMINGSLDPPLLKVKQGTTVEWINNGETRTVAASDASFSSGVLKPGKSFQHTFRKRGRYSYRCRLAEGNSGSEIAGTIFVTR